MPHKVIEITPTISANAADINDNNSMVKVVAPIANNTRQKITGARPIYSTHIDINTFSEFSGGGDSTIDVPRTINVHRVHRGGEGDKFSLGEDHSVVIICPFESIAIPEPLAILDTRPLVVIRRTMETVWEKRGGRDFSFCIPTLWASLVFERRSEWLGCLDVSDWVRVPHGKLDVWVWEICLLFF